MFSDVVSILLFCFALSTLAALRACLSSTLLLSRPHTVSNPCLGRLPILVPQIPFFPPVFSPVFFPLHKFTPQITHISKFSLDRDPDHSMSCYFHRTLSRLHHPHHCPHATPAPHLYTHTNPLSTSAPPTFLSSFLLSNFFTSQNIELESKHFEPPRVTTTTSHTSSHPEPPPPLASHAYRAPPPQLTHIFHPPPPCHITPPNLKSVRVHQFRHKPLIHSHSPCSGA